MIKCSERDWIYAIISAFYVEGKNWDAVFSEIIRILHKYLAVKHSITLDQKPDKLVVATINHELDNRYICVDTNCVEQRKTSAKCFLWVWLNEVDKPMVNKKRILNPAYVNADVAIQVTEEKLLWE